MCEYKVARNKVRAATCRIRIADQETIAKQCKLNPRVVWSYISLKRKSCGIIGDIKNIINEGETQIITHDKWHIYSFWTNVLSGVPQGPILGPILFIIYIIDIVECCSKSEIFLYADDGKIFKHP